MFDDERREQGLSASPLEYCSGAPGSWSRRPINQRTRRARWKAAIQVRGRLEHKMLSAPKLPEATALRAHAIMLRAVA